MIFGAQRLSSPQLRILIPCDENSVGLVPKNLLYQFLFSSSQKPIRLYDALEILRLLSAGVEFLYVTVCEIFLPRSYLETFIR